MKIIFLCFFIFILNPISVTNYDYSSYQATVKNEDLSGETVLNNKAGESTIYITHEDIHISNVVINKEGDLSNDNIETSELHGINSAVLVNGGNLELLGGSISTSAKGGTALFVTNSGEVIITDTKITSKGSSSARGLHSTYSGEIKANTIEISTTGSSCPALSASKSGIISCIGCELSTSGESSPLIYSASDITLIDTKGTSNAAQAVVVEGKNSVSLKTSQLKCSANGFKGKNDQSGVSIFDTEFDKYSSSVSKFICEESTIEIITSSSYFSSAPMFYVANTKADIELNKCKFSYGSKIFINIGKGSWENGATVTLNLINQEIVGDIVVDSKSSLDLILINSSIKGKINNAKTAHSLTITMKSGSKIILTGDSYYTSINNIDDPNSSNIERNGYDWTRISGFNEPSKTSSDYLNIYKQIIYSIMIMILLFA